MNVNHGQYQTKSINGSNERCQRCKESLEAETKIAQTKSGSYHVNCFRCVQCFMPFTDNLFFDFDGRKYCSNDFYKLYAPKCSKCENYITCGRVIKALNASWHDQCFRCENCSNPLESHGFVKYNGKPWCHQCNNEIKDKNSVSLTCFKCHAPIDPNQKLKFQNELYHAYHFNCSICYSELSGDAHEKDGDLYCLKCFDKIGMDICGACRRPIEERVIHALGKTWHVDHFMCAHCEKPFLGTKYYEKKGLPYCELHYQELFGDTCFTCQQVISGPKVCCVELMKNWCLEHFTCSICDQLMDANHKFHELDMKPACKSCFETLPSEFRKRVVKMHKAE